MGSSQVGENIRLLRGFYHESLTQLANSIHTSKSSIANIENAVSVPGPGSATIIAIAGHYKLPVDVLLSQDLSEYPLIQENLSYLFQEKIGVLLPILNPKSECDVFNRAAGIHTEYYRDPAEADERLIMEFLDCLELYRKAMNDDTVREAACVNYLAVLIWCVGLLRGFKEIIQPGSATASRFRSDGLLSDKEIQSWQEDISRDEIEGGLAEIKGGTSLNLIWEALRTLKQSESMWELADYYLAILMMMNCLEDETDEMNCTAVGAEMLWAYKQLGNPYAEKTIAAIVGRLSA